MEQSNILGSTSLGEENTRDFSMFTLSNNITYSNQIEISFTDLILSVRGYTNPTRILQNKADASLMPNLRLSILECWMLDCWVGVYRAMFSLKNCLNVLFFPKRCSNMCEVKPYFEALKN